MGSIKFPPKLKKGDAIGIVAPASRVEKSYIEQTIKSLTQLGYEVISGENIFSEYNQFAGTDKQRLDDFQTALDNKNIKAIFCARGGYGSIRIADALDFSGFRRFPKWIVGFSDITVFHSLLNGKYQIPSIHAPMPVNFSSPYFQENLLQLDSILKGEMPEVRINGNTLNRMGTCRGKLVGGNLSILYSLQSTSFEIDTKDNILFIEDVGEQLYHLDRMLNNLRLSGKLKGLKGLITGGMTAMEDKKRPFGKSPYEIIGEAVKNYNFPVAFDFPAGHIDNNVPFILGTEIELSVNGDTSYVKYIP